MSSSSAQPTHNTASILFSFLLGFLGISCVTIIGGLIWQRLASRWRREMLHPILAANLLNSKPIPKLWDVCIRDAVSAPEVSACAWDQLRPLALRVTYAANRVSAGIATDEKPKRSMFRRHERASQAFVIPQNATEDGATLGGCHTAIAMVIAYPSCAIKEEMGEFALGIAHMPCTQPRAEQHVAALP
ncbi:hypothetical protein PYCCODRAFT_1475690 [Trametes coccinea BRFM310]|uniref:Uncharacterized protein n=1 Tax=Trametes coccinea (strain BRFM310) TaxID=1353009 RepID=A0A1Y2IY39_TRAC3|nr:hypothetical protein PYCCODRAFT_1475690 [Trametes coccinea BRFM310]